ncbi:PAS domain-containing protein [Kordiimonas pumila]|uniref:PAS domain-containing protein n=1 Tax=Kordiimonas pumila TaxID=2161677 RepID=A0ABV7D3D3_9PROT|nr:PAS domain-containing protein [Kordiimonas pumila]
MSALPKSERLSDQHLKDAKRLFSSLKSCWHEMAKDAGGIPFRKQFSPAKVKSLLPYLYMMELNEDNEIRFRHRGTGIERSTNHRFLIGDHMDTYGPEDWARLHRYFNVIFSGPCAAEADWRYFCRENLVFDMVNYSLPLYGRDKTQRLSIGVMMVWPNYDSELLEHCTDQDYSVCRHGVYLDVGYGVPKGITEIRGR